MRSSKNRGIKHKILGTKVGNLRPQYKSIFMIPQKLNKTITILAINETGLACAADSNAV